MVQTGMTPSHLTLRRRHSRHVVGSSAAGSFLGGCDEVAFVVFESMLLSFNRQSRDGMTLVKLKEDTS